MAFQQHTNHTNHSSDIPPALIITSLPLAGYFLADFGIKRSCFARRSAKCADRYVFGIDKSIIEAGCWVLGTGYWVLGKN
jgi:hypothetical protein